MNTKDIGNIGEHIAIVELLKNNITVSRPLGDNARYDLVLEIRDTLYTCQVKATDSSTEEFAEFYLQSSQAHRGGSRQHYNVDLFILVDVSKSNVFLYFNTENKTKVTMRYLDTGSRQLRASTQCTWAKDYLVKDIISKF